MKKIIKILLPLIILVILGSTSLSLFSSNSVSAVPCGGGSTFLGFENWYDGLVDRGDSECPILNPNAVGGLTKFISIIISNCLKIAFRATSYITFAFILIGGFKFIISQGNSDKMAEARTTILNASIGLVIAISAVAVIQLVMNNLLGVNFADGGVIQRSFTDVLDGALNIFYVLSGSVAVIVIIMAGFSMVVSDGKSETIAKARNTILFASIGIVAILGAKALTFFILERF